jgi:ubiquinone/menaquinone biosynthesis C-methylase UbiE
MPSAHVLDLGAGNGWLSYQLSKRGHTVAAIDLQTNKSDGLGAYAHYDMPFTSIQAEFDHLPFIADQCDVAIFNSSFHYSTQYKTTLTESLRVLQPNGRVIILDTPIYFDAASGAQMVTERQAQFQRAYGFASDAMPSENFLTYRRLNELGLACGIEWQTFKPFRGGRWVVRPWIARLRRRREPAEFLLIVGARKQS